MALELNTISGKTEREVMLDKIKAEMERRGPSCGNFHIWYYSVYNLRKEGKMDMYRQAIESKYKGLGLDVPEQQ